MDKIPVRRLPVGGKGLDFPQSFNIRSLDGLLAEQDMLQSLHRHDFYYVLALKKGRGEHAIDFTSYEITDNSVFFMRPGQVHRLTLKAGCTGYLMQFRDDRYTPHCTLCAQTLREASRINYYQPDAAGFERLMDILGDINQEYMEGRSRYEEVIMANMDIFLIELIRQQGGVQSDTASLYRQERLAAFLRLLEAHMQEHKQVADYAAMMNMSVYQLNSITRKALDKTCSDLINEYIILEAKRYLLATADRINQIAYRLGYEDVSYFIRFFRKHTGHSPEAFRQNFS